jgi:hypothetical protein
VEGAAILATALRREEPIQQLGGESTIDIPAGPTRLEELLVGYNPLQDEVCVYIYIYIYIYICM